MDIWTLLTANDKIYTTDTTINYIIISFFDMYPTPQHSIYVAFILHARQLRLRYVRPGVGKRGSGAALVAAAVSSSGWAQLARWLSNTNTAARGDPRPLEAVCHCEGVSPFLTPAELGSVQSAQ